MLRKGMFLADRYEILDPIGTGGMSDVYKAKCHKLNRFVAIKVLKHEFSEDKNFVSKFRIEAQSAAGLTHPNVVNVYDVGDENGVYYIVMELVEGITLKRYIEKKGKLASKEAVSIAIQVAQGIEAAHSHHIIHRDIKPQNVIISKEGKVKVTDFGIARASTTNTITSAAMGSVHYISPEQARGGYSDERSDIYSFGITLYEMLTGTVPFDGDTTVSVAVQHIQDEIASPSKVVDEVPISVDKIVMKCTQKKTERRYQNITELIADLKKSLVMPNVDFVKMAPIFGDTVVSDVKAASIKTDMIDSLNNDDSELIDDLDDDYLLEDDDDEDKNASKVLADEDDEADDDDDDDDDIEDGSNEKLDKIMKWVGIGIVICIIIFAIYAVVRIATFGGKADPETTAESTIAETESVDTSNMVEVPNVVGKTEEEAKALLNEKGLGYRTTKQPSDKVEVGLVITQSSKAGSKVAKNTTITLSMSEGITTFTVPKVVNMTEAEATAKLKDVELKVLSDYSYNDSVEQGKVISQNPGVNSSVSKGDTITIVVSQGKLTTYVEMPDVLGKTEDIARQELDALGLVVDSSEIKESDGYAVGTVMYQEYSKGISVPTGTTIKLMISSGPKAEPVKIKVPSVINQTETKAEEILKEFKVQVEPIQGTAENKGLVISQSPIETAVAGTTITIYVSTGPKVN